jgi:isopentenyldiphosphate isomerase
MDSDRNEEMLEEWDWETVRPTGRAVPRKNAHLEGIPHEGVHLWVVRRREGRAELLFQKRAFFKESYPDCLDITVGGHVPFGLTENKVQKEAFEEIGLVPEEKDLLDLGFGRYEQREERGRFHREIQHVYMIRDDRPLTGYSFTDGEVTALAAVPLDELEALFYGAVECRGRFYDGGTEEDRIISRDDFHPLLFAPSMGEYMKIILRAARELVERGTVTVRMPL